MSVPVNQRGQGKLEVCTKARDLAVYTLQITKNKKVFAEEYQTAITDKIIGTALDIHTMVWSANNALVNSKDDLQRRNALQEEACVMCNVLLSLIDIAKPLFHLDTRRIMYWGQKVVEVRNLIRAWRNHASKGNTFGLLQRIDKYYKGLWTDE